MLRPVFLLVFDTDRLDPSYTANDPHERMPVLTASDTAGIRHDGGNCMERHEFLPRSAPLRDDARELLIGDSCPLTAAPRMERPIEQEHGNKGECGHGCDDHMEQDCCNGCGCTCVGYEGCGKDSWGLSGHPLAMVFSPCQSFCALYDPATALCRGTLFTELDLPLGRAEGAFTTQDCTCRTERRGGL